MIKKITIGLIMLLSYACSGEKKEEGSGNSKEVFEQKIKELEATIKSDISLRSNKDHATIALSTYMDYAGRFPDDPKTPGYIFKAAELANGLEKHEQAITNFELLITKYPEYEKVPQALFLQAFIYDNSINDDAKAKIYYEKFLSKYPDHELAKDAKISIEQLGKTDEELIEEFNKKVKA